MHEQIKCLPRNRDADDDPQQNHGPERNRNPRIFNIPPHGQPKKVVLRNCPQAGQLVDTRRQLGIRNPIHRCSKDIAELLPCRFCIFHRAVEGRVDIRLPEKAPLHMANTDNPRFLVVDFKCRPEPDRNPFALEFFHGHLIHHHRIRKPQVLDPPGQHIHWASGQRARIESCELDVLKGTVTEPRLLDPNVEWHRPGDPVHAANPLHFDLAHRDHLVRLLDFGIHHPDRRPDISHRRGRPHHQAAKHRDLLAHQQRAKREAADKHRILGPVTEKHLERDFQHDRQTLHRRVNQVNPSREESAGSR